MSRVAMFGFCGTTQHQVECYELLRVVPSEDHLAEDRARRLVPQGDSAKYSCSSKAP
jgi:hypothetical protein